VEEGEEEGRRGGGEEGRGGEGFKKVYLLYIAFRWCTHGGGGICAHFSETEVLVHDLIFFLALLAILKILKPSGWSSPSATIPSASSVDVSTVGS